VRLPGADPDNQNDWHKWNPRGTGIGCIGCIDCSGNYSENSVEFRAVCLTSAVCMVYFYSGKQATFSEDTGYAE